MVSKSYSAIALAFVAVNLVQAHEDFNILKSLERTGHGNLLELDNDIGCIEDEHCCADC